MLDPRGFIVFITAHGELSHMTFQYCIEAMDYIVKDYPERIPDRIKQCLFHAKDLISSKNNTIHKVISLTFGENKMLIFRKETGHSILFAKMTVRRFLSTWISLTFGEKVLLIKQEDLLCLHASQSAHKIKIYTNEGI